jgi:hypothetical protein
MISDTIPFREIQPIQSKVRVGNGMGIPIDGICTISLFVVLKDGSIKNVILNDCLYISGLMKSRFFWSKLESLNHIILKIVRIF